MRIEEVYQELFENYNVMKSLWDEVRAKFRSDDPELYIAVASDERNLSRISPTVFGRNVYSIAEAYELLVKANVQLRTRSGRKATQREMDSSFWISQFKRYLEGFQNRTDVLRFESSIYELLDFISTAVKTKQWKAEEKNNKENYKTLFRGDGWILYKPEHKAAACRLGDGTTWCISSRGDDNYFDGYSEKSDIFIIHAGSEKFAVLISKSDGTIVEVQTKANDKLHPDKQILADFSKEMARAGVDVKKVEEILNIEFGGYMRLYDITEIRDEGPKEPDPHSFYSSVRFHTPRYVFGNRDGRREIRESRDMVFIGFRRSDLGVEVAYIPASRATNKFTSLTSAIIAHSPAFRDIGPDFSEERTETIQDLNDLIKSRIGIDPMEVELIPLASFMNRVEGKE